MIERGFNLRIPKGPLLFAGDPLLKAASLCVFEIPAIHDQSFELHAVDELLPLGQIDDMVFQHAAFAPGNRIRPVLVPDLEDGTNLVAIRDYQDDFPLVTLPWSLGEPYAALLGNGLSVQGCVIGETISMPDGKRIAIRIAVYPDAFISVSAPRLPGVALSKRLPRVILVADGQNPPGWWDAPVRPGDAPVGSGPTNLEDIPISATLIADIRRQAHAPEDESDRSKGRKGRRGGDTTWQELWQRVSEELVNRFTVGFLGLGMTEPVWTLNDWKALRATQPARRRR
jgi:hypothetical protein